MDESESWIDAWERVPIGDGSLFGTSTDVLVCSDKGVQRIGYYHHERLEWVILQTGQGFVVSFWRPLVARPVALQKFPG